ncbi:nitroreductase family protein [Flavicella sediminum]|uniref:hypothetical protein n=1 Tax=Flavicella sediminum TaxID=2585141 RepID=UPI00111D5423|nr:hypothetical protein [Flavicella sediminum]
MKEIDAVIKNRKTQKVLANKAWPVASNTEALKMTLQALLDLAAAAPYHKKCDEKYTTNTDLNSCVPWRFYVLDTSNCRLLLEFIEKEGIKAGKINNMLAAADALLIGTWLPDGSDSKEESALFEGSLKNMEHIAAASAAIQNILLGATARNIPNYWSSGGVLRCEELRSVLKISMEEIFLGAVFLFPENSEREETFIKPGALRNLGKEKDTWSRWVNL